MKNFLRGLENNENGLRIAACLLFLPMFFITQGSILCTTDTGAYLQTISNLETQGLAAAIPMDRSVFYGLFLWAGKHYFGIAPLLSYVGIHLHPPFLFEILLVPCILLMLGAVYVIESFFTKRTAWIIAIAMSVATLLTPLPWFIFQVMPDVFTPLLFLYAMVFLTTESRGVKALSAIVLLVAALMHHSHLPLLTLFAAGVHFIALPKHRHYFSPQKTKQLFAISFIPWLITLTLNIWAGNGPTPSKGSHVFLIGKLCENGILKAYLDENPIEQNPLAKSHPEIAVFYKHKNNLPKHAWDFVWNEQPLLGPTGGWHHSRELYLKIYSATFTSPKLLGKHILSAIQATLLQVIQTHAGDGLEPLDPQGAVSVEMKKHFPKDHQGFFGQSAQQQAKINFGSFNQFYDLIAILFIIGTLMVTRKFPNPNHIALLVFTVFFILCNAFLTANLANILSRLNARTFWLLPMICAAILTATFIQYRIDKNQSTR